MPPEEARSSPEPRENDNRSRERAEREANPDDFRRSAAEMLQMQPKQLSELLNRQMSEMLRLFRQRSPRSTPQQVRAYAQGLLNEMIAAPRNRALLAPQRRADRRRYEFTLSTTDPPTIQVWVLSQRDVPTTNIQGVFDGRVNGANGRSVPVSQVTQEYRDRRGAPPPAAPSARRTPPQRNAPAPPAAPAPRIEPPPAAPPPTPPPAPRAAEPPAPPAASPAPRQTPAIAPSTAPSMSSNLNALVRGTDFHVDATSNSIYVWAESLPGIDRAALNRLRRETRYPDPFLSLTLDAQGRIARAGFTRLGGGFVVLPPQAAAVLSAAQGQRVDAARLQRLAAEVAGLLGPLADDRDRTLATMIEGNGFQFDTERPGRIRREISSYGTINSGVYARLFAAVGGDLFVVVDFDQQNRVERIGIPTRNGGWVSLPREVSEVIAPFLGQRVTSAQLRALARALIPRLNASLQDDWTQLVSAIVREAGFHVSSSTPNTLEAWAENLPNLDNAVLNRLRREVQYVDPKLSVTLDAQGRVFQIGFPRLVGGRLITLPPQVEAVLNSARNQRLDANAMRTLIANLVSALNRHFR